MSVEILYGYISKISLVFSGSPFISFQKIKERSILVYI